MACGDCERPRGRVLGQPVNTVSSLAFVVAGGRIWRRSARRPAWRVVAVACAAAGVGSVAYHGPGGRVGKALHDGALAALVAVLVPAVVVDPPDDPLPAAVVGALAGVLHATSRTGGPLCRPDSPWQGHAAWHVLAAVAVARAARVQAP